MSGYRVFLAKEVVAQLRACKRREQLEITRFFDKIEDDPFHVGDFVEQDNAGRDVHVKIIGRQALYYWADHAVKEVKVTGMRVAGS